MQADKADDSWGLLREKLNEDLQLESRSTMSHMGSCTEHQINSTIN
jgi:hypothetical protein